jgi:hypothetical protein
MSDIVILASRILMSAVFIVYGSLKFMDVSSIINNPGTKRFMDLVASGGAAPTWLGYLIAAVWRLGDPDRYQDPLGCLRICGVGPHCNGTWPSILDHGRGSTRGQSGELL